MLLSKAITVVETARPCAVSSCASTRHWVVWRTGQPPTGWAEEALGPEAQCQPGPRPRLRHGVFMLNSNNEGQKQTLVERA